MTVVEQESWEHVWNLWLAGLTPWEIHWLTPRELDLHDRFVAQEVSIAEVEAMIAADQAPNSTMPV